MSTTVGDLFHCCNRTFKTARALEQHVEHSPRHAEDHTTSPTTPPSQLESIIVEPRDKVEYLYGRTFETQQVNQQQNDSPKHQNTKAFDLSASILNRGYSPFYVDWDRDEGVSLTDASVLADKAAVASPVEAKSTERRKRWRRSAGREYRSSGVTSGNGQWYPDVGYNHGLCDGDCGWCGHCADEAGF